MPRIVIRIPYRPPSASGVAGANGRGNPSTCSSSSSQPKSQQPLEEKETTCCVNTHVALGSTDSEASTDSSTTSSGEGLTQWVRRKRPRSMLGIRASTGHQMSPSKIKPSTCRNMDDTNMDGSGGSPTAENDNGVNHPVLRSMVRKRSYSATQETNSSLGGDAAIAEAENKKKGGGEVVEWPKIQIELSKKDKEDDYFCMKGTKLPLRPIKKRPRAADKAIQNCLPGMSLLDLTRGRYDVRERKNARRKRGGLKGMDSDTD